MRVNQKPTTADDPLAEHVKLGNWSKMKISTPLQGGEEAKGGLDLQRKATIPEQKDVQAWQEINRQRDLGRSDSEIWFVAVREGDLEVVGALIRKPPVGFDVNQKDMFGSRALDVATKAQNNALEMVELLVEEGGVDIAQQNALEVSAYEIADLGLLDDKGPGKAELEDIAAFLKEKLNAEAEQALEDGDFDRIDMLVEAGADPIDAEAITARRNRDWFDAVKDGDVEAIRKIMESPPEGWNVDVKDADGQTALEWAVRYGSTEMLEVVTTEGRADILQKDGLGRTPLELAESLKEGSGGASLYDGKIEFLKGEIDEQAVTAARDGNREQVDVLMDAGAERPRLPYEPGDVPSEYTVRPEGDTRSADTIIKDNPVLANLEEREREGLKERVGDYESDPDIAFRAFAVLRQIERRDEAGKAITDSETVGNGQIDGYTKASGGHATHGEESGRLKDFIEIGYSTLKRETDPAENADIKRLLELADEAPVEDGAGKEKYERFGEFMVELKEGAYFNLISEAELPDNRKDILENPEKYSTAQKGAAALELTILLERVHAGAENYLKYGVAHGSSMDFELNTDPEKLISGIQDQINDLSNEEVTSWLGENEAEAFQVIMDADPALKTYARERMDAIRDKGLGLDDALNKEGDIVNNMRDYLELTDKLNMAAGTEGESYIGDLTVNIRDSEKFDDITREYEDKLGRTDVLSDLVEGGMTEEEAVAELNSRAATFAAFGSPPGDISASVNANIQQYTLDNTNGDELVGVILKENGELDEDKVNAIIDQIRNDDPESPFLRDDDGRPLSNGQIMGGVRNFWDSFRSVGKWNHSLSKMGPGFLSNTNPIKQAYGVGGMHFVSGLFATGALVAKGSRGDLNPQETASAIGSGMQALGLAGETFALSSRSYSETTNNTRLDRLRESWNKYALDPNKNLSPDIVDGRRDWRVSADGAKAKMEHFKNITRFVNASGGSMILGASIAQGLEELKKGNPGGAAVYFSAGAANFATTPTAYAQSLLPYIGKGMDKEALNRVIARVALVGGRIGSAANPIAFLALIGYELYTGIKRDNREEAYFDSFAPKLEDYSITGGPDPWWDDMDLKHNALSGS